MGEHGPALQRVWRGSGVLLRAAGAAGQPASRLRLHPRTRQTRLRFPRDRPHHTGNSNSLSPAYAIMDKIRKLNRNC